MPVAGAVGSPWTAIPALGALLTSNPSITMSFASRTHRSSEFEFRAPGDVTTAPAWPWKVIGAAPVPDLENFAPT